MKKTLSFSLILSLALPLMIPINQAFAVPTDNYQENLIALGRGGGGGSRGGGGGINRSGGNINRSGGNINRSGGNINRSGGNINRSSTTPVNRGGDRSQFSNRNQNTDRSQFQNRPNQGGERSFNRSQLGTTGSGRINRDQVQNRTQNIDRNNINRNNIDRNNINRNQTGNRINDNRDFNLNNDRNLSNRVNHNVINTGNRNVVVNPRGWGSWGWNGGRPWVPSYNYWGGGFWGGIAVGAVAAGVTSAVINSANNNSPTYIVIEQNSPGYQLFNSYDLIQVQCVENGSQVYIYGPQNSLMCANPNNLVPAGYYEVDPDYLTLIAR